jgi:hypothetical protein
MEHPRRDGTPYLPPKEYPGGTYPAYIVVTPGSGSRVSTNSVTYDPGRRFATRFAGREEAERWQAVLGGGFGTIELDTE